MCSGSKPKAPAAPVLPDVPNMSPEELDAIKKAGITVDQLNDILSSEKIGLEENQALLKSLSGVYGADGKIDETAVAGLRQRVQGRITQRSEIGDKALEYLGGFFDAEPDPQQEEIFKASADRLQRALDGTLPVSVGLKDRAAREFEILKEQAGRKGIRIVGDSLEEAALESQESSAAGRLISEAKKRFDLNVEGERQAELTSGFGRYMSSLGFLDTVATKKLALAGSLSASDPELASTLGFLQGSSSGGPANLIPSLGTLTQAQMGLAAPFEAQRLAQFNRDTQQVMGTYNAAYQNYSQEAASRSQMFAGLGQLGGMGGAMLMMNPATMPWGLAMMGGTTALGFLN